jgi:hypothetical protein
VTKVKGSEPSERSKIMRSALFLLSLVALVPLVACERSSGAPPATSAPSNSASNAPSADDRAACVALDSPDLPTRANATRRLADRDGPVVGGTEQQMDAAAAWCKKTFGITPSWAQQK